MSPIPLGILAASGAASGPSDFQLISTQILDGTATSLTFSSIPQTFRHLQLRMVAQGGGGAANINSTMRFNGDTNANYSGHNLQYYSSSGISSSGGGNGIDFYIAPTSSDYLSGTNPSPQIIDILDYSQTTKAKTARIIGGFNDGSKSVNLRSGNWRSTAAINSISITTVALIQYKSGSRFSLYGWN